MASKYQKKKQRNNGETSWCAKRTHIIYTQPPSLTSLSALARVHPNNLTCKFVRIKNAVINVSDKSLSRVYESINAAKRAMRKMARTADLKTLMTLGG